MIVYLANSPQYFASLFGPNQIVLLYLLYADNLSWIFNSLSCRKKRKCPDLCSESRRRSSLAPAGPKLRRIYCFFAGKPTSEMSLFQIKGGNPKDQERHRREVKHSSWFPFFPFLFSRETSMGEVDTVHM